MFFVENKTKRRIILSDGTDLLPGKKVKLEQPGLLERMKKERNFSAMLKKSMLVLSVENEPKVVKPTQLKPKTVKAAEPGLLFDNIPDTPVEEPDTQPEFGTELEGTKLSAAKDLIAATSNEDLLRAWRSNDRRKGVRSAIDERLSELNEGLPNIQSEEGSLPSGVDEIFGA